MTSRPPGRPPAALGAAALAALLAAPAGPALAAAPAQAPPGQPASSATPAAPEASEGSAPAATAAPPVLTLPGAFARAMEASRNLQRARREVPAADAQRRTALAQILPRISAQGNLALNSTEVSFGDPPDTRLVLPREDWDYRIVATQPLFAGLREKRSYDQAKLGVQSALQTGRAAEEGVLSRVASLYASALGARSLVDVETMNRELVGRRLKQARDLFEAGETTRVDLLRAEADQKAAEERVISAREAYDRLLGQLRVELALDGPVELALPDSALPPLPDEAELSARALRRPDVAQAEIALASATLEVKKQKGAHLPVLFAEAGWIQQKRAFPVDAYGYGALRLSFDLFRGGEISARVAGAGEREAQAALTLDDLRRRAGEDVRISLVSLEAARAKVRLADERLQAAQAEYDQSFDQYRNQLLTAVELQSAETSLADARRGQVVARLGVFLAEVDAWYAAGSLAPAALKETSR